jgi:hypothetical protein
MKKFFKLSFLYQLVVSTKFFPHQYRTSRKRNQPPSKMITRRRWPVSAIMTFQRWKRMMGFMNYLSSSWQSNTEREKNHLCERSSP